MSYDPLAKKLSQYSIELNNILLGDEEYDEKIQMIRKLHKSILPLHKVEKINPGLEPTYATGWNDAIALITDIIDADGIV